jgi:hypothetical protein
VGKHLSNKEKRKTYQSRIAETKILVELLWQQCKGVFVKFKQICVTDHKGFFYMPRSHNVHTNTNTIFISLYSLLVKESVPHQIQMIRWEHSPSDIDRLLWDHVLYTGRSDSVPSFTSDNSETTEQIYLKCSTGAWRSVGRGGEEPRYPPSPLWIVTRKKIKMEKK